MIRLPAGRWSFILPLALSACQPAPPPAASPSPASADAQRVYEMSEVDVVPVVLNQGEVNGLVRTHYPALLRDAGVEGTGTVRFVLGAGGVPEPGTLRTVNTSHPDFGPAAERVATRMRFSPALRAGAPVRVYVTIPISFTLR